MLLLHEVVENVSEQNLVARDLAVQERHLHALLCTGCPAKLFPLGYLLFCRLLLMQIAKVGSFMKNSGNLLQERHRNFEN